VHCGVRDASARALLVARASGTAVRRSPAFGQPPHAPALPVNAEVFDNRIVYEAGTQPSVPIYPALA